MERVGIVDIISLLIHTYCSSTSTARLSIKDLAAVKNKSEGGNITSTILLVFPSPAGCRVVLLLLAVRVVGWRQQCHVMRRDHVSCRRSHVHYIGQLRCCCAAARCAGHRSQRCWSRGVQKPGGGCSSSQPNCCIIVATPATQFVVARTVTPPT